MRHYIDISSSYLDHSTRAVKYAYCTSGYDNKQPEGEVPVMLQEIQSISSLPSILGPHRPEVVTPDWVLSIGQTELNAYYAKRNYLK